MIGLLPAVLVFLVGYMRLQGNESWRLTLAVALPVWGFYLLLFQAVLDVHWPHSLLGTLFPELRTMFEIF